jgi:3-methylfumaryl-CoA hydratase
VSEPVLADAGFTPSATATIAYDHVALLAATLDADPRLLDRGALPLPWHWTCFRPEVATADLGDDGHPRRRPEMAAFPRRMWVGGRVRETRALVVGESAKRSSRLSAAEPKEGSTGRFWLVTVEHTITQGGEPCIEEEQDLVLREPSAAADQGAAADDAPVADWVEARTADPALLFRYSALTFNAHRIHYDEPYATTVEGYPDLVVQGPLTATLLCELARGRSGRSVGGLSFRARVPLFANRSFWLTGSPTETGADLAAVRGDGQTAMTLTATLH